MTLSKILGKQKINTNANTHLVVGLPDMEYTDDVAGFYKVASVSTTFKIIQNLAAQKFHNLSSYTVLNEYRCEYLSQQAVQNIQTLVNCNIPYHELVEDYHFIFPDRNDKTMHDFICERGKIKILQDLVHNWDDGDHLDLFFTQLNEYGQAGFQNDNLFTGWRLC